MAEIESDKSSPAAVSGESNRHQNDQTNSVHQAAVETAQPTKKKRNLPGMPDPEAEVIALSPTTLMATNRFVCEICGKGFQRDQNLQLHRRGHNLPWKLRQRTSKEVRKRVYVCPEPSCVHHDPLRALGDLTGIKKHFCRKHGEKKHKCERCSKKYAVQSDWKAHMKACGTREYWCGCGTLFSRRDSFITHRAFCDALAQESVRPHAPAIKDSVADLKVEVDEQPAPLAAVSSPPPPPLTPSTGVLSPVISVQSSADLPENQTAPVHQPPPGPPALSTSTTTVTVAPTSSFVPSSSKVFASSILNPPSPAELPQSSASYAGLLCAMAGPDRSVIDPISLSLSSSLYGASSLFPASSGLSPQPALSATALLQKAAQMGATTSNSSFLRGLGLAPPSPSGSQDNATTMAPMTSSIPAHWTNSVKLENNSMAFGLGLGLPSSGSSGLNGLMMSPAGLFGTKPTTLDFLGLGMGAGEASPGGYSAFLSSIGGGVKMGSDSFGGVSSAGDTWDDPSDRKPSML